MTDKKRTLRFRFARLRRKKKLMAKEICYALSGLVFHRSSAMMEYALCHFPADEPTKNSITQRSYFQDVGMKKGEITKLLDFIQTLPASPEADEVVATIMRLAADSVTLENIKNKTGDVVAEEET